MAVFNVVRFKVKPGSEQEFIDAHKNARPRFKGFLSGNLVRTGEQTFCIIGEWRNSQSMAAARPEMIAILNTFRHVLEDLGGDLGVTDPVSGEVVARLGTWTPKKTGAGASGARAAQTPAKKAPAKKVPAKKVPAKKARR